MPESHRCPRGEDLVYIAHACTTGNFSHVLNGILRLAYLSPAGIDVVEWIISKRPEGQGHWPPSYDVVQEHFSEIDWPNLPDDISGLDPRFAVRDILYSEKTATCTETTARLHALMKSDFVDDNFPHLIREVDDRVRLIKSLGSPTPQARRLAENPDDTFGEIVGERGDQRFARFSMYFPEVNELLRPFEEGLHVRFARPKNCKSWLEEADALHWGVHKSEPTILADQENSRNSIQTRIACLHAGLSYATVRGIRLKKVEGTPLTPHEKEVYSRLYDAVVDIAENSNLVIYGKEQINIDTGRMSLDEILAEARDIGAAAIFIEQIHKLDVQGLGRNATETTRIHRVVQRLADSPFLSVVTTQEKRMQEKRNAKKQTKLVDPVDDWVFGGDAVSQNCSYLSHLQKIDLPDGSALIVETPVIAREFSGRERFFIVTDFCETFRVIPSAEGEAIAKAIFSADAESEDGYSGDDPSVPPAPTAARAVHRWLVD